MKNIITIFLFLISGSLISCSKKGSKNQDIPDNVSSTFSEMFHNAKDTHWKKINAFIYEADFLQNGEKVAARFSMDGNWQKTTRQINVKDLPKAVDKEIRKKYKNDKITYAGTVKDMTSKNYVIDVKQKKKTTELTYDSEGDLMNQITKG